MTVATIPAEAKVPPSPMLEAPLLADDRRASTNGVPIPGSPSCSLADPLLILLAGTVDDLERSRIATENRVRQLTRSTADADGVERGFGLDESAPTVATLAALTVTLKCAEDDAAKELRRALRKHPLAPWITSMVGVGEKQAARLLAAVGDPYWNTLHDRPRTVSELWAYCGLHVLPADQGLVDTQTKTVGGATHVLPADQCALGAQESPVGGDQTGGTDRDRDGTHQTLVGVAARRRKGQRANWSSTAKTRAYLIAVSCIKQARSPYRACYLERRARTTLTHPEWTLGHSHNDALRVTAKAVLRDLWIAARDIHAASAGASS